LHEPTRVGVVREPSAAGPPARGRARGGALEGCRPRCAGRSAAHLPMPGDVSCPGRRWWSGRVSRPVSRDA